MLRRVIGKTNFFPDHDEDFYNKVLYLYDNDESLTGNAIGKILGIDPSYVYQILERNGRDVHRVQGWWTPIKIKRLIYLRDVKKMTWPQIGLALDKSDACCQAKYAYEKKKNKI